MRLVTLVLLAAGCHGPPSLESPTGSSTESDVGSIRGVVLDAYTTTPLAGAWVGLRDGGARVRTDDAGRFAFESVRAGEHRVVASADGYLEGALANVVVRPGSATEIEVRLFQANPSHDQEHRWLERPERRERNGAPQERSAPEARTGDIGSTTAALRGPALPEMIRVWRSQGTPLAPSAANGWADRSCEGTVLTLPLEEYVKGVIPHEWIPSWHPEALRAGAIAARSYASSHALGGGRWECADVDDGTVTQVYRDDRAGPTDVAVDATAGVVVFRGDAVVRAEYSAENGHPTGTGIDDPVCAGSTLFGHGRGVCQWGTQRWASATCFREPCEFGVHGAEPKDHLWMMGHYFPDADVSDGMDAVPCAALGPEGGTIEDAAPCFSAYGPAAYWRTEATGSDGGLHWTNAFQNETPSNWARWNLALTEGGAYRVEVYVVDAFADYDAARYALRHDGIDSEIIVDLGRAEDGWLELGVYDFAAGDDQHLSLFDNYAAPVGSDQRLVADAVRLSRPGVSPPDAGTTDAGADTGSSDGGDVGMEEEGGCGCRVGARGAPVEVMALVALWVRRRRGSTAS